MSLTVVIATRGRPIYLKQTIEHTLPNIAADDTKVLVCVDDDDQETIDALRLFPSDLRMTWSIKPREDSRGEKYDRALTEAKADVYLPAVDCAPILTPGFDVAISKAMGLFEDGICCVHTNFANNGTFPPALQAFSAKWVEKMGYIYNHDYPFWFIDHEADDMARLLGRYIHLDIKVETASMRPGTTMRLRDLAFWTGFYDKMTLERRLKARAIIQGDDFKAGPGEKAALINCYIPIEARSYAINEYVRQHAASIEASRGDKGPPDIGYLRAKARAEQKLASLYAAMKQAA